MDCEEGAPGCEEDGGTGAPGWREEVDAVVPGCKEEGDVGAPGSEKKGDAGARGEACNFGSGCGEEGVGSGCGEEGVFAPCCDDDASTCKLVRDEVEDNCETGCFEGDDVAGAGEGCRSSRQVWLEGGD